MGKCEEGSNDVNKAVREQHTDTERSSEDCRTQDSENNRTERKEENKLKKIKPELLEKLEKQKQKFREQQPQNLILDDYQKEVMNCDGNFLLNTGRQCGKTFIMSRKSATEMIKHPNTKIIVCSLTEDQAQLIIVMTLDYLQRNHKEWIAKGKKAPTKNRIVLNNGSEILARPVGNTGDAVRGFTGNILILDEASRFNEFIFTASKPTLLTTGGKIWICSTPFGKQGYFYETYKKNKDNPDGRFKVIETNSWDVIHTREISEVWTKEKKEEAIRFLEDEKNEKNDLEFAQEYLAKFVDELRQFFPDELINRVCHLRRPMEVQPNRETYLGIDVARMGEDLSTFEILKKVTPEYIEQVENITTKKQLTTQTFDKILELNNLYNFRKIGIDAGSGSLGVGILDFLLRVPIIRKKVIALNNRSRDLDKNGEKKSSLLKEDMYQITKMMMERGTLHLLNDNDLMLSLKSVQYEYVTTTGKRTTTKIFGRDTHIAEGIVRASYLANQKSLNHSITWI